MTITSKTALRALYLRHCEQNALADTIDVLELTAAELCLSVEEVEAVVNEESESV